MHKRRLDRLIGIRVAGPAYQLLEHLAHESDRTISGMARHLVYEQLAQIADRRQSSGPAVTITDNSHAGAAAA